LGTLGGTVSSASAINSSGQVTGTSTIPGDSQQHAFRSTPNGQAVVLTDLGSLGGNSAGYAINSFGVVVGYSEIPPGPGTARAFVYDTQMRDLNLLIPPGSGWLLSAAYDINDAGQIVGNGTIGGQGHAFLLTPIAVPEPGALVLASLAAAGWLWRLNRRKWQPAV
jgi:probable HAF family extracellular repeat protein